MMSHRRRGHPLLASIGTRHQTLCCSHSIVSCLELHLVGLVAAAEGELGGHVPLEVGHLVDDGSELGVERLVVFDVGRGELLLLLLTLEEVLLVLLGAVLGGLLEVRVVELGGVHAGRVNLLGGGDDIALVHPLDRHAVDAVRAAHQEEPGLELPEEDDALALEVAGEEDEDGAGGDGGAKLGGVLRDRRALERELDVLGGVEARGLGLLLGRGLALVEHALERLLGGGNLHHRELRGAAGCKETVRTCATTDDRAARRGKRDAGRRVDGFT